MNKGPSVSEAYLEKTSQSRGGVRSVITTKIVKPPSTERQPIQTSKKTISVETSKPHFTEHIKKKKKISKKKKFQVINFQEEEDQQRLVEENLRREEIERFRQQQYDKMSKEERQRLMEERDLALERISTYEVQLKNLQLVQEPINEWNEYLKCQTKPNPRSERDLSVLLFQLGEQKVDLDCKLIVDKMQYAVDVLLEIQHAKLEDDIIGKETQVYNKYVEKISKLMTEKMDQIGQLYVINFDEFMILNNQAVFAKFLSIPFNKWNNKQILSNIATKPEERLKYEILKEWNDSSLFKFGIWFNPISKAGYRLKPVEFPSLNKLSIEIPRLYMSQSLIYKIHWFAKNLFTTGYEQYLTLGGVYVPECLELINSTKRTSRWTLKPAFDDPTIYMKKLKYPPKFSQQIQSTVVYTPFRVQFSIPSTLYLPDCNNLLIVCYQKEWTQEGVEDLNIDLTKKLVSFQLQGLYPFTLAQPTYVDLPYKQWRLCQVNKESVEVSIINLLAQRDIKFLFMLIGDTAEMIEPQHLLINFPQLKGPTSPAHLLLYKGLRDIGINLLPQEEDGLLCKSEFKLKALEDQALLNIIQGLHIISFQSSKFNRTTPRNQIIFQLIENPQQSKNIQEDDLFKWKTIQNELDKCALVKSQENDVEYNSEWMKNTLSHSNLFMLLQSVVPEDLVDKMDHIQDVDFKENVKIFLKMIKILCIG